MKNFFVSKKELFYFVVLLFIASILSFMLFLLVLTFVSVYLYISRKNSVSVKDSTSSNSGVLLAPITGVVEKVLPEESKLILRTKSLGPLGLYMPLSGNISEVDDRLILKTVAGDSIEIGFFVESFNHHRIWVEAGDIARVGANIGVVGFNSKMMIQLPKEAKILINKKDQVVAGQTLIAGLRG